MCGIAGIFYKKTPGSRVRKQYPVGEQLVRMMAAMKHRGADSTGFTLAGVPVPRGNILARLCLPETVHGEEAEKSKKRLERVFKALKKAGAVPAEKLQRGAHVRLRLNFGNDSLRAVADSLLEIEGVEIHCLGRNSEVIKDEGDALAVDSVHAVSRMKGTHGLGHNRLATESNVDVGHSHPFWAYPFPDVTTVHNGQLTNYHKLRRIYEQKGYRFQTHNDSELIAVYIADRLSIGAALQEALQDSIHDFDGTFTYLVSTALGIGYAKDKYAAKPLVVMERDDVVAVASEEVALRQIFPEEIERIEPQQSLTHVWLN